MPIERKQFTFYKSYYDAISELPKKDQANLILAVCAYALYEIEPKGLSIAASTAFKLIKPTLDAGRRKAENGSMKGKSSEKQSGSKAEANESKTEAKKSKPKANAKQGETESKKEREYKKEYEVELEVDVDVEGKTQACCDDGDYHKLNIMGGTLGRDVIKLSRAQSDSLLDQLGFDMYNYYVDRLADYIIKTGAVIHNHYETILKWWIEDGKV